MNTIILSTLAITGSVIFAAVDGGGLNWNQLLGNLFSSAGVCGLILGFHLLKLVPLLEGIKAELQKHRLSYERGKRADLIRVAASPHVTPSLKQAAAEVIAEFDLAEEKERDDSIS